MEDTTLENRQLVQDIMMSKSVEERFLMCAEMYETSIELAKIGMPTGLSDLEQRAFIFKRIHGLTPLELIQIEYL
jgi:hypothetical protein